MPFPKKVTLPLIRQALMDGFDGLILSSGRELMADNNPDSVDLVSDDRLPFLMFDSGSAQISPWQGWQQSISWDIPATLKIKGSADEVEDGIVEAMQDLMQRTQELIGLPIDKNGTVTPFTPASAKLFDDGKLIFLADRGAPFMRSFTALPSIGSYAKASIIFHVEATVDLDPRGELPRALQILLGVIPMQGSLALDQTLPDPAGIPLPIPQANLRGLSQDTTPDPLGRKPPLRIGAGPADADRVAAVLVRPYAVALSAGTPTQALSAISQYANWNTVHVERLATWQSSAPSVATVDATGLVTRVAAGSTVVSCTLNGVPSNGVAITCT